MLMIEEGQFVDCNDATVAMLGYDWKEDLLHTHPSKLSPEFQPDGRPSAEKADEMMRLAMEQGRMVMAVPGRIDSFSARGANSLIQDGAKMVGGIDDILEEFEYLFPTKSVSFPDNADPETVLKNLSANERLIFQELSEEEIGIDRIFSATGLSSPAISAALVSLELKRLIKRLPGKLFIRT